MNAISQTNSILQRFINYIAILVASVLLGGCAITVSGNSGIGGMGGAVGGSSGGIPGGMPGGSAGGGMDGGSSGGMSGGSSGGSSGGMSGGASGGASGGSSGGMSGGASGGASGGSSGGMSGGASGGASGGSSGGMSGGASGGASGGSSGGMSGGASGGGGGGGGTIQGVSGPVPGAGGMSGGAAGGAGGGTTEGIPCDPNAPGGYAGPNEQCDGAGGVGTYPGESEADRKARLERSLEESVGGFDEVLAEEQREISTVGRNTEGFGGAPGGASGGVGLGSQAGSGGSGGGSGEGAAVAVPPEQREASIGGLTEEEIQARTPEDIPDLVSEDIVARQLREAALAEEDPELRERLWEEYRSYNDLN